MPERLDEPLIADANAGSRQLHVVAAEQLYQPVHPLPLRQRPLQGKLLRAALAAHLAKPASPRLARLIKEHTQV